MSDDDPAKPVSLSAFSMLISRETPKDPPQSYVAQFVDGAPGPERQLTNYPHPYPSLRDMNREVIRYDRDDGVTMTATLYTPPGALLRRPPHSRRRCPFRCACGTACLRAWLGPS